MIVRTPRRTVLKILPVAIDLTLLVIFVYRPLRMEFR
jgi:hypothetical protein